MLERLDLLGMELAEIQGFERGCLRLAMITTARYFATRLIGDFCRDHPKVELVLEVVNRDQILERMRQNLDDLYIMGRPPEDQDVIAIPFIENPLVVLAPAGHPLCAERRIEPARLDSEAFILREPGSGTRQVTERYFADHGINPPTRMTLGSDETIKQACAAGLGLAVLSRHVLALDAPSGRPARTRCAGLSAHAAMVRGASRGEKAVAAGDSLFDLAEGLARARRGVNAVVRRPLRKRLKAPESGRPRTSLARSARRPVQSLPDRMMSVRSRRKAAVGFQRVRPARENDLER